MIWDKFIDAMMAEDRLQRVQAMLDSGELRADGQYGPAGARPIMGVMQAPLPETEDLVALLVERGADVHATDKWGHSVLSYAVSNSWSSEQKADLVRLLLERGVDVDEPSLHDQTALMIVAREVPTDEQLLEYLLSLGADPDRPDTHGATARQALADRDYEIRDGKLHDI